MTLIVGIRCVDGIVLAAESGAIPGSGDVDVTEGVQKIYPIDNRFLVALGGFSGQARRYLEAIRRLNIEDPRSILCFDIQEAILTAVAPMVSDVAVAAKNARDISGSEGLGHVLAEALVAFLGADGLCLTHVNAYGQCDRIDETLYHVIGAGEKVAVPFLSYIKRHVWRHKQPTMATGIISALWMLRFAHNCAGDFGPPWTVATLQSVNGTASIEFLNDDVLDPHHRSIEALEEEFGNLPQIFERSPATAEPPEVVDRATSSGIASA